MSEYKNITSFEEIIKLSKSEIVSDEYKMNFNIKVEFDIDLIENSLNDVHDLAVDFQNPKCPDNLHMNHGEHIHKKNDGIQNIIDELKNKKNSNRAIISLINQEDIVGSGDNPIPSFMILQFSIENNNTLYLTLYFRALEVSKFLRINIEEIRIIIENIKTEIVNIDKVFLNIIAFRAYVEEDINPLQRAELDLLISKKIFGILKKEPKELIKLLEEKKTSSTIIEYKSYQDIIEWMEDTDSADDIHKGIMKPIIKKLFKDIVEISIEIEDIRTKSSHSHDINSKQCNYKDKLDELIKELRNDN